MIETVVILLGVLVVALWAKVNELSDRVASDEKITNENMEMIVSTFSEMTEAIAGLNDQRESTSSSRAGLN
ncbi:MAG TPA: hypothetical protein ENJ50_06730 [Planctomycetaceae bacterium]|nr:hypothetical protein [Planctomycetaceae bacterium]